jgi:phage-related protein
MQAARRSRPTPESVASAGYVWPMSYLHAVYYRAHDGREPVRELLESLDVKRRVTLRNQIARLNLLSGEVPHLPFPQSSQVQGELRELRCHFGAEHYRVFYRRSGSLIVLLHAFRKTTRKLPATEIETAMARWEDFQRRMNATPRRPPRAAGHDAP